MITGAVNLNCSLIGSNPEHTVTMVCMDDIKLGSSPER